MKPNIKPQALSSWNSAHLDVVRSLATLAVVAEHTFRLFYATDKLPPSFLAAFAELCSRAAGESVMVFFVLSGFFICAIVKRSLGFWTWSRYLIDRFTRLYLVLLPALLFTALVDVLTSHTAGAALFLNHPVYPFSNSAIADHHTAGIFWGNLFFLQLIRVPAFGSDLPLWSLSSEFWYYMIFPCACLVFAAPSLRTKVGAGLISVCFVLMFPHRIVKYMLIWLLGALVYWLPTVRIHSLFRKSLLISSCVAIPCLLFAPSLAGISKWMLDLSFSMLLAVWLFILVRTGNPDTEVNARYRQWGMGLAACSYSIYVTHFPILLCIRSWRGSASWPLTPATAMLGVALVSSVAAFGWLFAQGTESHTQFIRKRVILWSEQDYASWSTLIQLRIMRLLRRTRHADPVAD